MWLLLNSNTIQLDALHGQFHPQEPAAINRSCSKALRPRERLGETEAQAGIADASGCRSSAVFGVAGEAAVSPLQPRAFTSRETRASPTETAGPVAAAANATAPSRRTF